MLSQAEHLLAAAHSLRTKLKQGLEVRSMDIAKQSQRELDVSTETILEGPELVIKNPNDNTTGLALQGLLAAQVATRVSGACTVEALYC